MTRRLATLAACAFAWAAPALALSSADQTATVGVRYLGATYVETGLDASAEVSLRGSHCGCSAGTGDASEDGDVRVADEELRHNDELVPYGKGFAVEVGDVVTLRHGGDASASAPEGFAFVWSQNVWRVAATRPLLGDVRLEFQTVGGGDHALHNDTLGSFAAVGLDVSASLDGSGPVPVASEFFQHDGPGSVANCPDGFCPGSFGPPFGLTLRAGDPLTTGELAFVHEVESEVEVGALPEPGSTSMLAAGALALAALSRRRT